jgi:LPXTG-motif cell wall-anchored protein
MDIPVGFKLGPATLVITADPSGTKLSFPVTIHANPYESDPQLAAPAQASPGERIRLDLSQFAGDGGRIDIALVRGDAGNDSEAVHLGATNSDSEGKATVWVTIPKDTALGPHVLTGSADIAAQARTRIMIVAGAPTPNPTDPGAPGPGDNGGELPNTGSDIGLWLLIIAGVAVLGGAALLITSMIRRRRSSAGEP